MFNTGYRVFSSSLCFVCLLLVGCSAGQDSGKMHSIALPASDVEATRPSVSATSFAEVVSAVTRSAITLDYDPAGSPTDAGGASRCFACEVVSFDADRRSVSLDPVEFFLGEDASREAQKDGKDEDAVVYIRNTHQRTDNLPLVAEAPILVRNGEGLSGLTVSADREAELMLKQGELGNQPLFLIGLGPAGIEFLCQLYTP